jgi:hypothetical protein
MSGRTDPKRSSLHRSHRACKLAITAVKAVATGAVIALLNL